MSRRRRATLMLEDLFHGFAELPWWAGAIGAPTIFLLLWFVPGAVARPGIWQSISSSFAHPLAVFFGVAAALGSGVGVIRRWGKRRLFDKHSGPEGIRSLTWQEFERLVAESYRRQGFAVTETGSASGDGGFDVILQRGNERVLVQAKHWKTYSVGVVEARGLLGAVRHEKANRGILITSGRFTEEARAFSRNEPLELVDGEELKSLLAKARKDRPADRIRTAKSCPDCGAPMVLRTAGKGVHKGSTFWGCSSYPSCMGKREVA